MIRSTLWLISFVTLATGMQSLATNSTQECLALGNSSSFTVGNVNVSLTSWCDGQGFQYSQVLQLLYLNDLNSCLLACKEYTETEPWPCTAINFDNGTAGPPDIGGYLCELVWNSTGGPSITNQTGTSSAALTYHTTNTTMLTCSPTTSYNSSTGAVWEIFCNADLHSNDLHLGFAEDVYACIDLCDLWNTNTSNVQLCKGLAFDAGTYGPSGELQGSACWLKFDASEAPDYDYTPSENTIVVHSAMLVSPVPNSSQPAGAKSEGISTGGVVGVAIGSFVVGMLAGALVSTYVVQGLRSTEKLESTDQEPPAMQRRQTRTSVVGGRTEYDRPWVDHPDVDLNT